MTVDEMLAQPGPLLAAWDLQDDRKTLRMYNVTSTGATFVGRTEIAADAREETNTKLLDKGARIGYASSAFLWAIDESGFSVWTKTAQLAYGGKGRDAIRVGSEIIRTSEIKAIEVFVDPENMGHRGVRLDFGDRHAVLAEENFSVESNPTYSEMDLEWELNWAEFLGRDVALWLRLPYRDRHGKVTNAPQLAIYAGCCALADKVAAAPAKGEFENVVESLGPIEEPGEVVLRYGANPLEDEGRFVEQRVSTPSGKSYYGRWLKLGTNRHITWFLRDVRTPATIMANARDLRRKLVEDEYE